MEKNKHYSFNDKKIILQSLNRGLINGYLDPQNIYKFDKIFNKILNEDLDFHVLLFKIWNQEKKIIRAYNNDKQKLKTLLEYINEQINIIESVNIVERQFLKNENNILKKII